RPAPVASTSRPRGRPPPSASSSAETPLDRVGSGASRVSAGLTCAPSSARSCAILPCTKDQITGYLFRCQGLRIGLQFRFLRQFVVCQHVGGSMRAATFSLCLILVPTIGCDSGSGGSGGSSGIGSGGSGGSAGSGGLGGTGGAGGQYSLAASVSI